VKRVFCVIALFVLIGVGPGCALFPAAQPAPITLSAYDFARIFDNYELYTDVWYMGTDDQYHHFCFEHWTFKSDGGDATLDRRQVYLVSVQEWRVARPFPYVEDESQWRLLRPKRPSRYTGG
jgi:hypothetical protein